ncbi:uncharacterized protein LOC132592291 isoform X2 [Zootoca vivipara]|uniref:uncharacterized protein LOC132592291 isoform X2 n=1 Tax=Zootoca vivipara TaxID=8524 RepID=UPI00293BCB69|nr:uncharacterized protein LOC132592291 isoform X2 [Zootoca vivipara]
MAAQPSTSGNTKRIIKGSSQKVYLRNLCKPLCRQRHNRFLRQPSRNCLRCPLNPLPPAMMTSSHPLASCYRLLQPHQWLCRLPPPKRNKGKQPRRPRKERPAKGGVSGVVQDPQAAASSNVLVSPVSIPQCSAVALRLDLPSTSSAEDTLPVPARTSRGGKHHRKRHSRKCAKRRRDNTSVSTTTGLADVHIWMVGHSIVHWAGLRAG